MGPEPRGSFFFVGSATTIIRLGSFTVLTDPNFLHSGQRAYLGMGISTRRRTNPALEIADLPALDAMLLTHLHGDHWDRASTARLPRDIPVVTTPEAAIRLQRLGFGAAQGLRTWEHFELRRGAECLSFTAVPAAHGLGRLASRLPAVTGAMLQYRAHEQDIACLYITGDTVFFDALREIPQRFPQLDTAILHLGGMRLPGVGAMTLDAARGADLVQLLPPSAVTIPVHFDDYGRYTSPLSAFRAEINRRGLSDRVRYVVRGETVQL